MGPIVVTSSEALFVRSVLSDRVKLRPSEVHREVMAVVDRKLRQQYEGVCSRHGLIRPGSIEIMSVSPGLVLDYSLNGDVEYTVTYSADICNPVPGLVVKATVMNTNRFGILATASVDDVAFMNIIVPKEISEGTSAADEDVANIKSGDVIHVEIIGRKFDVGDKHVSVVGKLVRNTDGTLAVLQAVAVAGLMDVEAASTEDTADDDVDDADDLTDEGFDEAADDDNDVDAVDVDEDDDDDEDDEDDEDDDPQSIGSEDSAGEASDMDER